MHAWRYTIPAFVVPFMFALDPKGIGILFKGSPTDILWTNITAFIGISALAAGAVGWIFKRATVYERVSLIVGGLFLVYPTALYDAIGFCLIGISLISQRIRKWGSRGRHVLLRRS